MKTTILEPELQLPATAEELEHQAELSELHWTLEHLQSANRDLEAALDCFTTPEDDEAQRFELAQKIETLIAVLDGNLALSIGENLGPEELGYLHEVCSNAARRLRRFGKCVHHEFGDPDFALLLNELGSSYAFAADELKKLNS